MNYFERRRQEEEEKRSRTNNKESRNIYLYMFGTFALATGVLAASYFWLYRPEHKTRLDAQKDLSKTELRLQFTELQKDSLSMKLTETDSLKDFYVGKTDFFSKRSYVLDRELTEFKVLADSTESRLKSQIVIVSDSLVKAKEKIDNSEIKISSLETRLQENDLKIKALIDSTYSLSNTVLTQSKSISDKDLKIENLTPPNFDIINNTSLDIYAQTSQEKQDQGYGFGVSTKLFGNSTAGVRARVDAIFSLDENKTNKDFGGGPYLKDRQGNFVFEFVGGVNMQRLNVGGTDTKLYIRPCINLNMFGVRGLYLSFYSKGVDGKSPSIGLGTSFGKK